MFIFCSLSTLGAFFDANITLKKDVVFLLARETFECAHACYRRTLFCWTHRFFWYDHYHYTPPRCCAQRLGPLRPPESIRKSKNRDSRSENSKRIAKKMRLGPQSTPRIYSQKLENKKNRKCRAKNMSKNKHSLNLSSRLHENSILTIFGGSKMTPPRAL